MRFIPILFSTLMVQALLKKVKTVTRRTRGLEKVNKDPDKVQFIGFQRYPDGTLRAIFQHDDSDEPGSIKCPYGEAGDILWVRETFYPAGFDGNEIVCEFFADSCASRPFDVSDAWCINEYGLANKEMWPRWKPNIHMPKNGCRLFLKVKDIRVERLHAMTNIDAIDEGVMNLNQNWIHRMFRSYAKSYSKWRTITNTGKIVKPPTGPSPLQRFTALWKSINGRKSWSKNPWVWVVEFEQINKPENFN